MRRIGLLVLLVVSLVAVGRADPLGISWGALHWDGEGSIYFSASFALSDGEGVTAVDAGIGGTPNVCGFDPDCVEGQVVEIAEMHTAGCTLLGGGEDCITVSTDSAFLPLPTLAQGQSVTETFPITWTGEYNGCIPDSCVPSSEFILNASGTGYAIITFVGELPPPADPGVTSDVITHGEWVFAPEPASALLLLTGIPALIWRRPR